MSFIWKPFFLQLSKTDQSRRRKRPWSFQPQVELLEEMVVPSSLKFYPTYVLANHPSTSPQASTGTPSGLSPSQIRTAYGFNQITLSNGKAGDGTGETIALVDAYDDPSIASDLATFDQQFGLAAPPSFVKVGINSSGAASTTTFPTANQGWAGEIELDVEWAHAIAPGASILLVEANSASDTDLMNAVDYARNYAGVVAVSMSWGGSEFSGEASYDSHFTTPAGHVGVTFFASAGDSGSPLIWPAVSTHVVGVGGTTLTLNSSALMVAKRPGATVAAASVPTFPRRVTRAAWSSTMAAASSRPTANVGGRTCRTTRIRTRGSRSTAAMASAAGPRWAAPVTRRPSGPD